jgi:glyoxylase-like metal-dependent hydrolase (beta-lactamase superfamily II)
MALVNRTFRLGPMDNGTYLVWCPDTREAAVIDMGFEPEVVLAAIEQEGLTVRYLLNTHAHYDHVCGMRAIQRACGGEYWLHPGDRPLLEGINQQAALFQLPPAEIPEGFHALADHQTIPLGNGALHVIHTPGHSPGGVCFRDGDHLWVGDTLFAGSVGRTDLPGGSFPQLANAIRTRLFTLGDRVIVLPGHGDATTIGEERLHNPFVGEAATFA